MATSISIIDSSILPRPCIQTHIPCKIFLKNSARLPSLQFPGLDNPLFFRDHQNHGRRGMVFRPKDLFICKYGAEAEEPREIADIEKPENAEDLWTQRLQALGDLLSSLFPLWVGLACVAGMLKPSAFVWIKGRMQIIGITITMLGMGMTLSFKDLKGALSMPRELAAGVVLQYTIMPTAGALVARLVGLPSHYAAGLVLVACCPGGTASNVVTYLARGNVALSVLMTAFSTFLAVIMTPMLTAKLAGQYVAVDAGALVASTLQVVLLPVLIGAGMAHYFPRLVRKISPLAPTVAVITIAAICASAIAQSASAISTSGFQVFLGVALLHGSGFLFGYLAAKVLGFEESTSRTISIEVGMQERPLYRLMNSVLGVVLATQHFSNPLTAVPCAISSVCHSVFGSALAGFWRAAPEGKFKTSAA